MSLLRSMAVGVVLSVLGVGSAQALVIEYTDSFFTSTSTNGSTSDATVSVNTSTTDSVQLQGFDASLGALTGVDISFTSSWDHGIQINASDSIASYSSSVSGRNIYGNYYTRYYDVNNDAWAEITGYSDLAVGLADPASSSISLSNILNTSCERSIAYDVAYNVGVSCYDSLNGGTNSTFNSSLDLSTIDIQGFVRADSDFIDLDFINNKSFDITCDNDDAGDSCSGVSRGSWRGNVTVAYTYDTFTSVPEPSSIALMGLGLVGLGFARRKKAA